MPAVRLTLAALALVAALSLAPTARGAPGDTSSLFIPKRPASAAGLGTVQDKKIIGGTKVSIQLRPYMAQIGIVTGDQYEQQCGGTILDKRHVLTAAHCVSNQNFTYRVRVGSDFWRYRGQLVAVARVLTHPKYYKAAAYDCDVAVVRLAKDLVLGPTVQPVTLVKAGTPVVADKSITLLGWGYTDPLHSDPLPATLRQVTIATIDHEECEGDYSPFDLAVTSRMFCGMAQDKDSCQGDSGGPVLNDKTGEQVGIISWSMGCAQMGSPAVFTNLADAGVRSFIDSSLKK